MDETTSKALADFVDHITTLTVNIVQYNKMVEARIETLETKIVECKIEIDTLKVAFSKFMPRSEKTPL